MPQIFHGGFGSDLFTWLCLGIAVTLVFGPWHFQALRAAAEKGQNVSPLVMQTCSGSVEEPFH